MLERWYPATIRAGEMGGFFDSRTVEFLTSAFGDRPKHSLRIGEIGIWKGATSLRIAEFLQNQGELHLFDYADNVEMVKGSLNERGFHNVTGWGSSYKYMDSYNWSLKRLIETHSSPVFDSFYLDGAHTWAVDALTFFLCDILLKPGGFIDFDDYQWRLRGSGLDPSRVPETAAMYTDEQIDAFQVKDIVDLLVKRNPRYEMVVRNKIFRKIA